MAKNYAGEVKIPSPQSMNGGLSKPDNEFMMNLFGPPRKFLSDDCQEPTNPKLKAHIVTMDVGPFRMRGLKPFCEAVKRIMTKVKAEHPELYKQIGTAGGLCCRRKRGLSEPSNHSFGAAVDLTINGRLDQRGDAYCQEGLLILYTYFHNEDIYWAAEYKGKWEDSMHWEASKELLRAWRKAGLI